MFSSPGFKKVFDWAVQVGGDLYFVSLFNRAWFFDRKPTTAKKRIDGDAS